MKNAVGALFIVVIAVACSGCSGLSGTYKLNQFVPPDAAGQYEMASITFHPDGTFTSEVRAGETTRTISGTYEFDRENDKLTFVSEEGTTRTYNARMCTTCHGVLIIWNDGPRKEWEARMMRK